MQNFLPFFISLLLFLSLSSISANEFGGKLLKNSSSFNTHISFHAQELAITSPLIAKELYRAVSGEEKEADLVHGLYMKYGEYLYCVREPEGNHHCSIYLGFNDIGELSSYYTDSDFGKGNTIEAIYTKPLKEQVKIKRAHDGIHIIVSNKIAKKVYHKLNGIYDDYEENQTYQFQRRVGKHLDCYKRMNKITKKEEFKCLIEVKMWDSKKPEAKSPLKT